MIAQLPQHVFINNLVKKIRKAIPNGSFQEMKENWLNKKLTRLFFLFNIFL